MQGLGHLGVQLAKCMGYRVVAIDVRRAPLDLIQKVKHKPVSRTFFSHLLRTKALSQDLCITTSELGNGDSELRSYLAKYDIENIDASIVLADSNAAFDLAIKITAKHGTVIGIGMRVSALSKTNEYK